MSNDHDNTHKAIQVAPDGGGQRNWRKGEQKEMKEKLDAWAKRRGIPSASWRNRRKM